MNHFGIIIASLQHLERALVPVTAKVINGYCVHHRDEKSTPHAVVVVKTPLPIGTIRPASPTNQEPSLPHIRPSIPSLPIPKSVSYENLVLEWTAEHRRAPQLSMVVKNKDLYIA